MPETSIVLKSKSPFVVLLAWVYGLVGIVTSLFRLIVGWIIPSTKARIPAVSVAVLRPERPLAFRKRSQSFDLQPILIKPETRTTPKEIRRHSSFHTGLSKPNTMTKILQSPTPHRPTERRRISFNIGNDRRQSSMGPLKTTTDAVSGAFSTIRNVAETPIQMARRSTFRSSDASMLVASSGRPSIDLDLDSADISKATESEIVVTEASVPISVQRPSLSQRIPSVTMKGIFGGRKSSNGVVTTSRILDASGDSGTYFTDTPDRISSETSPSLFPDFLADRPNPLRSGTAPLSLLPMMSGVVEPEIESLTKVRKSTGMNFSNPWPSIRSSTAVCLHIGSGLLPGFTSSNNSNDDNLASTRPIPLTRQSSTKAKSRTASTSNSGTVTPHEAPFGPTHNAPMPTSFGVPLHCAHADYDAISRVSNENLDFKDTLPVRTLRRVKPQRIVSATVTGLTAVTNFNVNLNGGTRSYPQDDLMRALDKKLGELQFKTKGLEEALEVQKKRHDPYAGLGVTA